MKKIKSRVHKIKITKKVVDAVIVIQNTVVEASTLNVDVVILKEEAEEEVSKNLLTDPKNKLTILTYQKLEAPSKEEMNVAMEEAVVVVKEKTNKNSKLNLKQKMKATNLFGKRKLLVQVESQLHRKGSRTLNLQKILKAYDKSVLCTRYTK